MLQKFKLFLCCFLMAQVSLASAAESELMLVGTYQNQDVQGWVMSEKLDGVRGYWNGKQLFTRQGVLLPVPDYFVQDFPPFAIDGELFSERNHFAEISSITRSLQDKGWHKLKLYVFDVPQAEGNLFQRLAQLQTYLQEKPNPYIEIIPQIPIENSKHIQDFLHEVENKQGEGLVLRNPNAPYEAGKRSSQILKLKTTLDEECTVVEHHKGKGQFSNVLGSLTCENERGQFKIGSGFSLEERINPPAIGAIITYKYRGLTTKGKPRFATYWRERK